jgi:hypothetical protein
VKLDFFEFCNAGHGGALEMAAKRLERNGTACLEMTTRPLDGPAMRKEGFRCCCGIDFTSSNRNRQRWK